MMHALQSTHHTHTIHECSLLPLLCILHRPLIAERTRSASSPPEILKKWIQSGVGGGTNRREECAWHDSAPLPSAGSSCNEGEMCIAPPGLVCLCKRCELWSETRSVVVVVSMLLCAWTRLAKAHSTRGGRRGSITVWLTGGAKRHRNSKDRHLHAQSSGECMDGEWLAWRLPGIFSHKSEDPMVVGHGTANV